MLVDAESYQRFGIHGNAVAERGTITPEADRAQYKLVFAGTAAVEDEGAVHASVGANDEADAHAQIAGLNVQQRVRGEQGFGRTDASTSRQGQRLRHGRKFGNVRGNTAQVLFQLRERDAGRNDTR